MHSKLNAMKSRTEIILVVLKYLSLLAAIGFSIECGMQLFYFVASMINPEWAKNGNQLEQNWYVIHQFSRRYFVYAMSLIIPISALKAWVWYLIFGLLLKLKLKTPFSIPVNDKLETISKLLLGIWILISILLRTYSHYIVGPTGIALPGNYSGDEYIFVAGIVYIISKIFTRGIELQEENQLTV